MCRRFAAVAVAILAVAMLSTAHRADAAPCKPPGSQAMLTGPVYQSIQALCNWVDAINRRAPKAAAAVLDPNVRAVGADGTVRDRAALLAAVAKGDFGPVAMNVKDVATPFSAGSTNVVISTWTFHKQKHRVTDVFFCDVTRMCVYRLISEQITLIGTP